MSSPASGCHVTKVRLGDNRRLVFIFSLFFANSIEIPFRETFVGGKSVVRVVEHMLHGGTDAIAGELQQGFLHGPQTGEDHVGTVG